MVLEAPLHDYLPNGFESISETLYTMRTAGRTKCLPYNQEVEETEKNMQYVLPLKHSSSSIPNSSFLETEFFTQEPLEYFQDPNYS